MSKLLKLKEWLTLEETASHLTEILDEKVTEADLLRLALDKHLVISAYFMNGARGEIYSYISREEAYQSEISYLEGFIKFAKKLDPDFPCSEVPSSFLDSLPLRSAIYLEDIDKIIKGNDEIVTIDGVWDLPLIGCEMIDLEYYYQQKISGIEVTLVGLDGTFLKRGDKYANLYTSMDDDKNICGSRAYCDEIEQRLQSSNLSKKQVEKQRDKYKLERENFLRRHDEKDKRSMYYPAGSLDQFDYIFVVRTSEINRFIYSLSDSEQKKEIAQISSDTEEIRASKTTLAIAVTALAKKLANENASTYISEKGNINASQIVHMVKELVEKDETLNKYGSSLANLERALKQGLKLD